VATECTARCGVVIVVLAAECRLYAMAQKPCGWRLQVEKGAKCVLSSLFRSKLGFSRILEILYDAFDGVHVFSYSFAGSEPICMKFGALWEHCLSRALADFGRDPRINKNERVRRIFCEVNNERLYRFPVGQVSRNLHARRRLVSQWILLEQSFANFTVWNRFFSNNANLSPKSSTTCDFEPPYLQNDYRSRKFTTNWPLYGMFLLYCTHVQMSYVLNCYLLTYLYSCR